MESDLHPKSSDNKLMKYADDTNLLVPENTSCTLSEEFEHIKDWATANKMIITMSKTKELVFYRPHTSRSHMPLAVKWKETSSQLVIWMYELVLLVCACVRYSDATQPVEDGLVLIERGLVPTDCYWPGTETVIHDVSSAQTLKVPCY